MLREGGVIADGYDAELDELRAIQTNCGEFLLELEARERARTGIANLKVEYNRVHGFYIEVTRAQADKVPDDYRRRQTLKNAERYITPELKTFEDKALSAQERALAREKLLYERAARRARAAHPALQARGRGARRARRAVRVRRARRRARLPRARVRRRAADRDRGRPPSRSSSAQVETFIANDTRLVARAPDADRHRPQHGRQIDLHAAGRADRAARALRLVRAGAARAARPARRDLHAHRRGRRSRRRALDVHGRDDRGRLHPAPRHAAEPRADGRDRPRHLHLRRAGARLGDRAPPRREERQPHALRDPLLRADARSRRSSGSSPTCTSTRSSTRTASCSCTAWRKARRTAATACRSRSSPACRGRDPRRAPPARGAGGARLRRRRRSAISSQPSRASTHRHGSRTSMPRSRG